MIDIDNKLLNDINEYCIINNIENPSKYASKLLKKAFMEEKYGTKPDCLEKETQKTEEIEVVQEINKQFQESSEMQEMVQQMNEKIVDGIMNIETKEEGVQIVNKQVTEEQPKKSKKRKLN